MEAPLPPLPAPDVAIAQLQQKVAVAERAATGERPFAVEVRNPASWFDTFKQVQQGELPRRGFTVGRAEFNDDTAQDLRCAVRVTGGEKDPAALYDIEAKMAYSPSRLEKDGGFHPVGDTIKIADQLRERGVKVRFKTAPDGQQALFLEKGTVKGAVNLGWASQQEMPKGSTEFGRYGKDAEMVAMMGRHGETPSPGKEKTPQHNIPIEFHLVPQQEPVYAEAGYTKAQNPDELA